MLKFENFIIQEAARKSLARIYELIHSSKNPMAFLTGFRGENDYKKNTSQNKKLVSDIKSLGWGYVPVLGGYVEKVRNPDGTPTGDIKRIDNEESFFVVAKNFDRDGFDDKVLDILRKYQQEAAVIIYPSDPEAYMMYANGHKDSIGRWTQDKLSDYFTRIKTKPNRIFSFKPDDNKNNG